MEGGDGPREVPFVVPLALHRTWFVSPSYN